MGTTTEEEAFARDCEELLDLPQRPEGVDLFDRWMIIVNAIARRVGKEPIYGDETEDV